MDNKSDEFIRDYILIINQSFDRTFQENQDKTIGSFSKMIGDIRRPDVISRPVDAGLEITAGHRS